MITNYERILDIILEDLIPLTKISINEGNKYLVDLLLKNLTLASFV